MSATFRQVLITQNQLRYLRGSEITTLELAEYFIARGSQVTVYCLDVGGVVASELQKLHTVRIVSSIDTPLSFHDFDLVWVHHQVLPLEMIHELSQGVALPTVVFHHMSAYVPLEAPFLGRLETLTASVSSCNSLETLDALRPYFSDGYDRLAIFPNPVGINFSQAIPRSSYAPELSSIAVVSNHPPKELQDAVTMLRDQGITIDFVGDSHQEIRVTPMLLQKYDCVISIGKTCQYSLVLGIPVYCYDHFGGPGYLNKNNYDTAEALNFSGRGFKAKTAQKISQELVRDFANAASFAASSRSNARQAYGIEQCMTKILANIKPHGYVHLTTADVLAIEANQKILRDYISTAGAYADHVVTYQRVMDAKATLQYQFDELATAHANTAQQLHALQNRRVVRWALQLVAITKPDGIRHMFAHIIAKLRDIVNRKRAAITRIIQLSWRTSPLLYTVIPGPNHSKHQQILGLTRIHNEALILKDTLDHLATIVDGIIVYDDASTDASAAIASKHPAVIKVIVNKHWRRNRAWEETANRQVLLNQGKQYNPQWFLYADADERFEGNIREYLLKQCPKDIAGIKIQLFDAYITPEDKQPYTSGKLYNFRKLFGIERRDILMLWRNQPQVQFWHPDAREPSGINPAQVITKFYCQHYGKSLSVQHWEDTCMYYMNNFPKYSEKWRQRQGKAIHRESDFNTPLYTWSTVKKHAERI